MLRRRFVRRRFVEETFCKETFCMCVVAQYPGRVEALGIDCEGCPKQLVLSTQGGRKRCH